MCCFRAFGVFVFACVHLLRVNAYAFAFACCKVAFHVTRVDCMCVLRS